MANHLIDPGRLKTLAAEGSLVIFDTTFDLAAPEAGQATFSAGHIPGARYAHLDRDLSGPPTGSNGRHPLPEREALAAFLRRCGLRKGEPVVVYDSGPSLFAARMWWLLRWLGHDSVAVLDGGFNAWLNAGGAVEFGVPRQTPEGDFAAGNSLAGPIVAASDVSAGIDEGGMLVVDARSPERFAGIPHPLDAVSGHIPGARNRFCMNNLSDNGRFKPAAALRAEFAAIIGSTRAEDTVMQCGSGVTACHNLLAMEMAGLGRARLYPGSWSEWISDPSRPIEQALPGELGG